MLHRWFSELEAKGYPVLRLTYEDDLNGGGDALRRTLIKVFEFLGVDSAYAEILTADDRQLPLRKSPLSALPLSKRVSNWRSLLKALDGAHRQVCTGSDADRSGCCSDWMSTIKLH
jgi:hypothetical protein